MATTAPKVYHGMRSYSVHRKHGDIVLQGSYGAEWETNTLRASCGHGRGVKSPQSEAFYEQARKHLLKDGACSCGIYAVEGREIENQYRSRIYASVVGWGAMVIGGKGWRAEYVRIDKIWIQQICDMCYGPYYQYGKQAVPEQPDAKLATWATYTKNGPFGSYLCSEHLQSFILGTVRSRTVVRGLRFEELVDEIKEKYKVEVAVGKPW